MRKWRIYSLAALVMILLAEFHVFGFHEPDEPKSFILVMTIWIIWCICDGVDKITGENSKWW